MEFVCGSISEAWSTILRYIMITGRRQDVIASGVPRNTTESRDIIMITMKTPLHGMIPAHAPFSQQALDAYAAQLLTPDNPGFDYTYGSRLLAYPMSDPAYPLDQLRQVKEELRIDASSRKALAITWCPEYDLHVPYSLPCLILCDFKLRDGMLNMVAYFRSHDAYGAWPVNA
jgi:thymidylate synthase